MTHAISGQKSLHLLQYLFIFLTLFLSPITPTPSKCGGIYRAPKGVIQTPDFPRRFHTPIDCEWIIDASHYDSDNNARSAMTSDRSIVVYLTQVYVKRGLTFSDYDQPNGTEAEIDVNSSIVTYVQSYANYLVIRLHLDSVVGTHMRVLYNFLDVYGLNITYEITTNIRNDSCKISTCGFLGYCYYNFENFFCDCLPGFEGPSCSEGPKSLCVRNGVRACENSTCKHVGEKFYVCGSFVPKRPKPLVPHFKVKSNMTVLTKPIKYQFGGNKDECDDCRISCPWGKNNKICKCQKSLSKVHELNDIGYTGHFVMDNSLTAPSKEVEDYLNDSITQTLKICNISADTLTINKLDDINDNRHVYFHLFGSHVNKNQLQSCFRKSVDGGFGNFSFLDAKITLDVQPSLFLKNVRINKLQPIYEGQEFILSCLAIGSPNMTFRWYKDNIFINVTTPSKSNKWIQLERKDLNAYWSVLGISEANELDGGLFTCQVADFGRQQCASQRVYVNMAPSVYIEPTTLTVKQGEGFDIICREDSGVMVNYNRCKFKWLENGIPLTNNVEPIYPKGSLLKVAGINVNTVYSCTCTAEYVSKEASITVNVYNPSEEVPCKSDSNNTKDLENWPDTAPGVSSLVGCPNNYFGFVSRTCLSKYSVDSLKWKVIGKWTEPDYSGCLHRELDLIKRDFRELELGYASTNVLKIINAYENYVINRGNHILVSEGKMIFLLLNDVLTYIAHSSDSHNIRKITNAVLNITNALLSYNKAIYIKDDIILMQKVVKTTILLFAKTYNANQDFNRQKFNITISDVNSKQKIVSASFSNLKNTIFEAKNNKLADYTLISEISNVWFVTGSEQKKDLTVAVNITDKTKFDFWLEESKHNENNSEFQPQCVISNWGFDWTEDSCITDIDKNLYLVNCQCATDGAFAVAYIKKLKISDTSSNANQVLILLLYTISLFLSIISVTLSIIQFHSQRTAVSFMQSHSSCSKLIICVIFTVGTASEFTQESCLYILSTILFFYLLALSSIVSILIITYTELEDVLRKEIAKINLAEMFLMAPILAALGNHIAHASLSLRLPSWWIKMADNMSFNVFTICLVILVLMFVIFYWIVWHFIKKEIVLGCVFVYKKYNRVKKCLYLFCAFLANIMISIFYINNVENLVLHYGLVSSFILIDVMILLFSSDDRKFHFVEIISRIANSTKANFGKSLKTLHIFNKN